MAIFSTRSSKRGADEAPINNVPIDSIETLRTRARQRLIGAVVLVALGIISFALLFDSQPRPIPVDIAIIMPDKDRPETAKTDPKSAAPAATVAPAAPAAPAAEASVVTPANSPTSTTAAAIAGADATAAAVQASASLSDKEEIVTKKPEPKVEKVEKVEKKPEPKSELKPELKVADKAAADKAVAKPSASDEAAKALAILEGRAPAKTKVETKASNKATADEKGRFVVQVGAFAENEKARAARLKVERVGLKTYVNVAETPQGKRIRVRAGPFATRAEAEKAAAKIKTLDLPAAILTL